MNEKKAIISSSYGKEWNYLWTEKKSDYLGMIFHRFSG
jgi:hypothetical protein